MADMNDLFFFGNDFDAVLDILEIDEDLEKEFTGAVDEVSIQKFLTLFINLKLCFERRQVRFLTLKYDFIICYRSH